MPDIRPMPARPPARGQPPAAGAPARPGTDALYLGDAILEALGHRPHPRLYPYFLGVNRLGTAKLAASATISDQAPVGGDASFLAAGLIGQGTGDFLLTLKWSHLSGAAFSQVGLHSKALFSSQWRPFAFVRPQLMPHDSTLTVEITNLTTTDNEIAVYCYGYKVMR